MDGGEGMPFNEMTDRELIIKLYAKMDNLADDVCEIKQTLRERPCPSPRCNDHEGRIISIESYMKILGASVALIATAVTGFILDRVI